MSQAANYIKSAFFEFKRYRMLGNKTFDQLSEKDFYWTHSDSDNSIAIIVKHMVGNMRSRWTNFLTEDGEKSWRDRETEFTDPYTTKTEILHAWENGWQCVFDALNAINEDNFDSVILIRNEKHTLIEAINRQLAHYASHVGQIVLLGKMIKGNDWVSLSIPKGESEKFNKEKFGK
ncbi:DUF1572 domain-containing protein [Aggregatimonas sangjinii]|uniref:DUF1572 domain-containing protein n=1 Tax=Aggregatimonas sangjinii TaxID=2583587 RepID=A0A5B7SLQ0_9FLAO|nr:DUF1572 family protein [Aggregatimonas sangjinii]QCW99366.1 DUF1572 domain-containing protein [Aggregatimonas sangjinii]